MRSLITRRPLLRIDCFRERSPQPISDSDLQLPWTVYREFLVCRDFLRARGVFFAFSLRFSASQSARTHLYLEIIMRSTYISPEKSLAGGLITLATGWYSVSDRRLQTAAHASITTDVVSDGLLWLVVAGSPPLPRRYVNTAADDQSFYHSAKLFSTFQIILTYLFRRVRSFGCYSGCLGQLYRRSGLI